MLLSEGVPLLLLIFGLPDLVLGEPGRKLLELLDHVPLELSELHLKDLARLVEARLNFLLLDLHVVQVTGCCLRHIVGHFFGCCHRGRLSWSQEALAAPVRLHRGMTTLPQTSCAKLLTMESSSLLHLLYVNQLLVVELDDELVPLACRHGADYHEPEALKGQAESLHLIIHLALLAGGDAGEDLSDQDGGLLELLEAVRARPLA